MFDSPYRTDSAVLDDDPLGAVELTSGVAFGVRAAALAGIPTGAGGRTGILEASAGTWHITCSVTFRRDEDQHLADRPADTP